MEKISNQSISFIYRAEDGRTFRTADRCLRYEELCRKWLGKLREGTDLEGQIIHYYPITSYDDLQEIKDLEAMKHWNYLSISIVKKDYEIPGWVYCPSSPSGNDDPKCIEPISHLKELIKDTEESIQSLKLDIANMEEISKIEADFS